MIEKVKEVKDGFIVNENIHVPNDTNNGHHGLVMKWIEDGNTPEPEFTDDELLELAKKEKTDIILEQFNKGITSNIEFDSHEFQVNTAILAIIANHVLVSDKPLMLLDADNKEVELSVDALKVLLKNISDRTQKQFKKKLTFKDIVRNATSIDELKIIK